MQFTFGLVCLPLNMSITGRHSCVSNVKTPEACDRLSCAAGTALTGDRKMPVTEATKVKVLTIEGVAGVVDLSCLSQVTLS